MDNETQNKVLPQNTTGDTTSLSQLKDITEAFSGDDFTKITSDEFTQNPLAGKIMTMLYAENVKKLKEANDNILDLTKEVSFYQSFPTANMGYTIMNVIGTIVVGLGVSLSINVLLIVLGSLLVVGGNVLPLLYLRKRKKKL